MTNPEQPSEEAFDGRSEMAAIFAGVNGQGSEPEAVAELSPDEAPEEGSESDPVSEDPDGEETDQETEKDGKKVSRWQKQKQRTQQAEQQAAAFKDQVHEALDHVEFFQAESLSKDARIAALEAQLEELGYGLSPEQRKLSEYETREQREAHYAARQKAAKERQAGEQSQAQLQAMQQELVEAAEVAGIEDWREIAREAYARNVSTEEAVKLIQARKAPAKDPTPAELQARKNGLAPAVINSSTGATAKHDYKPGSREHFAAELRATGAYN